MQPPLVDSASLFRLVQFFDMLAAVVFAVSGALVASRKGLDVMGFMLVELVNAATAMARVRYQGLMDQRALQA
jgi:glycine transporter